MQRLLFLMCAGAAIVSCSSDSITGPDGYEDCTGGGLIAFSVTVVEEGTGRNLAATATLTWRAGLSQGGGRAQVPTAGTFAPTAIPGAYGRPGNFQVTVDAPGYASWHGDIRVNEGVSHCSVRETVNAVATLKPL